MNSIEMTSHTIIENINQELKARVDELQNKGCRPGLAVVLVGHNPKSELYVSAIKQRQAEELGIDFTIHRLDEEASEDKIIETIQELNRQPAVSGIIVQLPLPEAIDLNNVLNSVKPEKDVDGLGQNSPYLPPTVSAIMRLLEEYDVKVADQHIVIVGKGKLVGQPLYDEMKKLQLNVEVCDQSTENLADLTSKADILISATGQPNLINSSMVKQGAVVIDVDYDVNYELVAPKTSYITPQKGGVGPLTVTYLLSNVVDAAESQNGL